jgi:CHAT domain-containing protein
MANKEEDRLKKVLQDMSHSLNHIEDIMADDRALLVKLVKQNNSIVEWLKQVDIEAEATIEAEYDNIFQEPLSEEEEKKMQKFENLKEVLDEFMSKRKDLIEFEKELKKHKDQLTPGQIGES